MNYNVRREPQQGGANYCGPILNIILKYNLAKRQQHTNKAKNRDLM